MALEMLLKSFVGKRFTFPTYELYRLFQMIVANTSLRAQRLWMIDNYFGNVVAIIRRKTFQFSGLRARSRWQNAFSYWVLSLKINSDDFLCRNVHLEECCAVPSSVPTLIIAMFYVAGRQDLAHQNSVYFRRKVHSPPQM